MNPLPVSVSVVAALPTAIVAGVALLSVGSGLATGAGCSGIGSVTASLAAPPHAIRATTRKLAKQMMWRARGRTGWTGERDMRRWWATLAPANPEGGLNGLIGARSGHSNT